MLFYILQMYYFCLAKRYYPDALQQGTNQQNGLPK